MAVLTSTASAPISIASAACDGAPIPASTTTGTVACSMMISMLLARFDSPRAANRRTERHDRRAADVFEALRQYRIGIDVRQNRESLFHENFGCGQRLHRVGQQITRVGMNLQLEPSRQSGRGGQVARGAPLPRCARRSYSVKEENALDRRKRRMLAKGSPFPENPRAATRRSPSQFRSPPAHPRMARSKRTCPCRRAVAT